LKSDASMPRSDAVSVDAIDKFACSMLRSERYCSLRLKSSDLDGDRRQGDQLFDFLGRRFQR
jgi:hypothetical protein